MRRQHNERDAERRNRKKAQATLVTIEVLPPVVKITNHSEQQVRELHIESIINAPVRWGNRVHEVDMDGEEYEVGDRYGDIEQHVLQPHTSISITYEYFDADDRVVPTGNVFNERILVDYVTITFDMSGVRWRLTGNEEPVRVVG
jgi:hypothetical protein